MTGIGARSFVKLMLGFSVVRRRTHLLGTTAKVYKTGLAGWNSKVQIARPVFLARFTITNEEQG